MTDMTSAIRQPTAAAPVTPVFTACTTSDKFSAGSGSYMLYYRNGATPTGALFVNEKAATAPAGAVPGTPAGASKWSDLQVASSIGASTDRVVWINDITPYVDNLGFVNLQHTTPTTLTLSILGPL